MALHPFFHNDLFKEQQRKAEKLDETWKSRHSRELYSSQSRTAEMTDTHGTLFEGGVREYLRRQLLYSPRDRFGNMRSSNEMGAGCRDAVVSRTGSPHGRKFLITADDRDDKFERYLNEHELLYTPAERTFSFQRRALGVTASAPATPLGTRYALATPYATEYDMQQHGDDDGLHQNGDYQQQQQQQQNGEAGASGVGPDDLPLDGDGAPLEAPRDFGERPSTAQSSGLGRAAQSDFAARDPDSMSQITTQSHKSEVAERLARLGPAEVRRLVKEGGGGANVDAERGRRASSVPRPRTADSQLMMGPDPTRSLAPNQQVLPGPASRHIPSDRVAQVSADLGTPVSASGAVIGGGSKAASRRASSATRPRARPGTVGNGWEFDVPGRQGGAPTGRSFLSPAATLRSAGASAPATPHSQMVDMRVATVRYGRRNLVDRHFYSSRPFSVAHKPFVAADGAAPSPPQPPHRTILFRRTPVPVTPLSPTTRP